MSLKTCVSAAGDKLDQQDRALLLQALKVGASDTEALAQLEAEIRADIDALAGMVEDNGGTVLYQSDDVQPWQMTKDEYNKPVTLKPMETFYVKIGDQKVEVVRNPSSSDINAMTKEAISSHGRTGRGDPVLRFTYDEDGNVYRWAAYEAIHAHIEPVISKRENVTLNQNASEKPSHRSIVRRALYEGQKVPDRVVDEYPGIKEEVRNISGNKMVVPETPRMLKDEGDISGLESGKPVSFHFRHNTESATGIFGKPKKGDRCCV